MPSSRGSSTQGTKGHCHPRASSAKTRGFHTQLDEGPEWRRAWHPLQYSCLENSMDRGAWWARIHGVAKSWTRLSD